MLWRPALFRKRRRVHALTHDDGALVVDRRRVEIRFALDDPRAYRAKPVNVRLLAGELPLPFDRLPPGVDPGPIRRRKKRRREGLAPRRPRLGRLDALRAAMEEQLGERWVVHTDGSFRQGHGGAGVVVVTPEGEVLERAVPLGSIASSMAAEAAALLAGQDLVPDDVRVSFYTDCRALSDRLARVEPRPWEPPVVAELRAGLARFDDATVHHVKGHAGHPLNEQADRLAGFGARLSLRGAEVVPFRRRLARPPPELAPESLPGANDNAASALTFHARHRHAERVALLLDRGADPRQRNLEGRTALHQMAYAGGSLVPELWWSLFGRLVERGADPNALDREGRTPLDLAWDDRTRAVLRALGARTSRALARIRRRSPD